MEWNKAKSVLLAVLLCANLFLAGNLALQIAQGRTQQRQAMDQALELLHQDLGDFDETMFRAADGLFWPSTGRQKKNVRRRWPCWAPIKATPRAAFPPSAPPKAS